MELHPTASSPESRDVAPPGAPPADQHLIHHIQHLYDRGLFTQALVASAPLGPLRKWSGTDHRILAGRLSSQLSANRLSQAIILRAWRADRLNPAALFYGAMATLSRRGPLASLDMIHESGLLEEPSSLRWEFTALAAYLYATYRDFETANRLISTALDQSGTDWIWTQRAAIYEIEDRYDEALKAARRAHEMNPSLQPAVYHIAHLLSISERDDEAMAVLRDGLARMESPHVAAQLAIIEIEKGLYAEALRTLDVYERLAPLKAKESVTWLAGRRSDVYGYLGDVKAAAEHARLANSPYYEESAVHLENAGPDSRRILLAVGFVRQHHMTCAPATLSAISRFWDKPAEHLDVAEAICYDGTPYHSERRWATDHGWYVREFTVTWDAACALIDAGIPFALTTSSPGGSHLQAVIGYDSRRRALCIRDPYERLYSEYTEKSFFKTHASTGPRGMAMVPAQEEGRLANLHLPEADLYDLIYELQKALEVYDRSVAATHCAELVQRAPGHRLTLKAQRSLACYDADQPQMLAITEELIAQHPKDVSLRLEKADLLRQLTTNDTYRQYLNDQLEGSAVHSLFRLRCAQAMLEDGRQLANATRLLTQVVRRWNDAETMSSLADAYWHAGSYQRAVSLYRLAATKDDMNECRAAAYFRRSRLVHEEQAALAFLRTRVERFEKHSAHPAMTLHQCLMDLERSAEAQDVMTRALTHHPLDGSLLLFAAKSALNAGARLVAAQFLQRAKDRSKASEWLRTAAQLQESAGELRESLHLWKDVIAIEPLNIDAQRAVTRLTSDTQGRSIALQHVRQQVHKFPHHQQLNELLVEWLDEASLAEQEEAVQRLLAISPSNAWARRQMALILGKQRRFDEAHAQLRVAYELAPEAVTLYTTKGHNALLAGNVMEARRAFREALRRSVDSDYALRELVNTCGTIEERESELRFVLEEMKRQIITGDSLLTFQRVARNTFEPAVLASILEEARGMRPDLWQSWVACARQHIDMQQYEAAEEMCKKALEQFSLLPRLKIELAEAARLAGNRPAERTALREALHLNPASGYASRQLAESYEADGDFESSHAVLQAALRYGPSDPVLHGYLGHTLWQLGQREEALGHLQEAVRIDIGYEWAWGSLQERSTAVGQADAAINLARDLIKQRAGDGRAWLALARMSGDQDEKLAALEQVIALTPMCVDAHAMKLDLLIEARRFDEVQGALQSTPWGDHLPVVLEVKWAKFLAERGEKDNAITCLQTLLRKDPNYYAGWQLLADWRGERDDHPAYLAAARELHRIAPDDAYSLGYLADALSKTDPQTDVRPYLRRAVHLKPDYAFAAHMLFDLELSAGNLDAAEAVLAKMSAHLHTASSQVRALRLCVRRDDRNTAMEHFSRLWSLSDDDLESFRHAVKALSEAGWTRETGRILDDVVHRQETNPHAGTLWVEHRSRRWVPLLRFYGFRRILPNGELGRRAGRALLEFLGDRKATLSIRLLIRRYRHEFAADDITHGMAAYALTKVSASRAVVTWFGDWKKRNGTPAWALLNLACAFHDLGQEQAATAVSRHALTLEADHTHPEHQVWLASHAAHEGNCIEAERLLAAVDGAAVDEYYQFVIAATQAHIYSKTASQNSPWPAWSALFRAWNLSFAMEPALRRHAWRASGSLLSKTLRVVFRGHEETPSST